MGIFLSYINNYLMLIRVHFNSNCHDIVAMRGSEYGQTRDFSG